MVISRSLGHALSFSCWPGSLLFQCHRSSIDLIARWELSMSSNKKRRQELNADRQFKREKLAQEKAAALRKHLESEGSLVDRSKLAPNGSYDDPDYVIRGHYVDIPFSCRDCGKAEVWTAQQQKWWYEVAQGGVWTTARRCRPCRRKAKEVKDRARQIQAEGMARKQQDKNPPKPPAD